jgi:putative FmdB family regulatory protein
MPTYEYVCEDCGHSFERFQTIKARPLRKCPECGKVSLRRLIGVGAGIIFKGSGFYETDYRSESYKKAAEKEKGGDKKETDKKETKAESKGTKPKAKTESDAGDKKKSA